MSTTSQNTMTTTVSQRQSRCGGYPEPQIELRCAKGTPFRAVGAALHKLAADVELATPERECWVIQIALRRRARPRVPRTRRRDAGRSRARDGGP
jgi:hypothetical protein